MGLKLSSLIYLVIFIVYGLFCAADAQNESIIKTTNQEHLNSHQMLNDFDYTTVAYKNEVLRLLIKEANDVARQLKLSEQLPITKADLTYVVIGTPKMAALSGGCLGTIGTSNYDYSVAEDNKLCFIMSQKLDSEEARNDLKAKYLWPIERCNTNTAHQLALQWLAAIHMDVKKIEHDSKVHIWSWTPDGVDEKHFVPLYVVTWMRPDGPAASVELLEPTRLLGKLDVDRSEYILRRAVEITNMDALLSKTNISDGDGNQRK